jgi:short subunit dehydrogenase-like uncharacterized protein
MVQPLVALYGATGYTGRLIAQRAAALGLPLRLGGRNADALIRLSAQLGHEHCQTELHDPKGLDRLLEGARVLLNAAGPFARTAAPLMAACVSRGVSYLDLSGEVDALAHAATFDVAAREARVMIMPAVGFDVIPSDCLASRLFEHVPTACALHVAVSGLRQVSRGSARTLLDLVGQPVRARRAGRLVVLPPGDALRSVDFGSGERAVSAVDWGDIVTAYFTTGVPNITVYFESSAALRSSLLLRRPSAKRLRHGLLSRWIEAMVDVLPEGPDEQDRAAARCVVHVSVVGSDGECANMTCETGDVYTFTAESACEVASRVSAGDLEWGFQTPARVYGSSLLRSMPSAVVREMSWA